MEKKISYKNISIGYSVQGTGEKSLLAFHGFGQTKDAFDPIAEVCSNVYTIYSLDLFFHGNSVWDLDQKTMSGDQWREIIAHFIQMNEISKMSLLGYSMGGKFVLATLEAFPEQVEKIILIAPDGIKRNIWYHLVTSYKVPRIIFKKTIDNPKTFLKISRVLERLKLVNKRVLKFVKTQMNTKEQRYRAYHSWVVFRKLSFDIRNMAKIINDRSISLEIFLGKHDKMFTKKEITPFLQKIKLYKLEILDTGHNGLINKVAEFYKRNKNI